MLLEIPQGRPLVLLFIIDSRVISVQCPTLNIGAPARPLASAHLPHWRNNGISSH